MVKRNSILQKSILIICIAAFLFSLTSCSARQASYASDYTAENYNHSIQKNDLFASDLCVLTEKTEAAEEQVDPYSHGYALFNTGSDKTVTWYKAEESLFPASTTKLMTALLALKSGKLDETVTVSQHAVEDLEEGSSVCGLKQFFRHFGTDPVLAPDKHVDEDLMFCQTDLSNDFRKSVFPIFQKISFFFVQRHYLRLSFYDL